MDSGHTVLVWHRRSNHKLRVPGVFTSGRSTSGRNRIDGWYRVDG